MKYYVYILKFNEQPFYVGKGTGDRLYLHESNARNTKQRSMVLSKIRKIQREGGKIEYEYAYRTDNEHDAFEKEKELIALIGRKDKNLGPLCNMTDGGEGLTGYSFTSEHKENISKALKIAALENRTGLVKARETMSCEMYKTNHKTAMQTYWDSDKGKERKKQMSEFRKSLLDENGKRVLTSEARLKMSQGAKLGNVARKMQT